MALDKGKKVRQAHRVPRGKGVAQPSIPRKAVAAEPRAARTCIVVLGMHRSGTSALTRVLNFMGSTLPRNTMGAGIGNETGHWEPQRLYEYNERLLSDLGSSWHDWRPLELTRLTPDQRAKVQREIADIINSEVGDSRLFVVKEPRTCRFADFFIEALENAKIDVRTVLIIRNPLEVIASLRHRDTVWPAQHTEADAALLWLTHVVEAERATRDRPRSIVTYECLLSNWKGTLETISVQTEIAFPVRVEDAEPLVAEFLTSGLRHHVRAAGELALDPLLRGWVSEAYEALLALSTSPHFPAATATFDRIHNELQRALPVVDAFFSDARRRIEGAVSRLSSAEQASQQLRHTIADARSRLGAWEGDNRDLLTLIDARNDHIRNIEASLQIARADLVESAERERALEHRVDGMRGNLAASEHAAEAIRIENQRLRSERDARSEELARISAELENTHAAYRSSTSWKITSPLRALKGIFEGKARG